VRTLSSADIQAANASSTGEIYHLLITISHPNMPLPITVTSDAKVTVSNGVAFVPVPFVCQLPDDRSDQLPVGKLSIDNTDLAIIKAIRSIGTVPASVLLQVVLGSSPDAIEIEWELTMRNVNWDVNQISMDLRFDEFLDEPYPGDQVTPSTVPAVFLIED